MTYGLPSTEEQIAAIRADSDLSFTHIDTCLSSYLQDHHNRPGECLFGVYVDGSMTNGDVLQGLLDEIVQSGDRVPDPITWDEMKACAKSLFADVDLKEPFSASLESPPREEDFETDEEFIEAERAWEMTGGDEMPQAWFLLVWTPSDEETAA